MKAALLTKIGAPLELCDIEMADQLQYGQVLVKVLVSGVCGRQLKEISGAMPGGPLPHPLGHEGCGIVEEIGQKVKHVKIGDKVVMHWRKGAGIESACPRYAKTVNDNGGIPFTGGRVTTFMQYAVCSENRLTTVPKDTPDELCALLGCSLSTALGTLEHEANLLRGESILIVGCGGLGANLILGARMMGAHPIFVTDVAPKDKLAYSLEATVFLLAIPGAYKTTRRFDVIVETSGDEGAIQSTLPLLAPGGRYILVGQPKKGNAVSIDNAFHLFEGEGKMIKATQGGRFRPEQDCLRYVNYFNYCAPLNPWKFHRLDRIVSHRFTLSAINNALQQVKDGNAGRVLIYPHEA
jgi:Zn-dependent alcohol dehydrogenase